MPDQPIISCVPVSWPTGLGELMRMVTLAEFARRHGIEAQFHFFVNRHIPAAARKLIPAEALVTRLGTSPTLDTAEVTATHAGLRPAVVLFDNAGTGRQCRHAKLLGARTVFLSTRAETRARGLRLSWLPWLDEHWIIGPTALVRNLTSWQKVKTRAGSRPVLRRFQSIFSPSDPRRAEVMLETMHLTGTPYACFLPGGGGGSLAGRSAPAIFADAAELFSRETGATSVLLQGPLAAASIERSGVVTRTTSHEETVDLVGTARLVIVGASSSLFQALAQQKVCVATSSGGSEQSERARAWTKRGVVASAEAEPDLLARAAVELWRDDDRRQAIRERVAHLGVTNDLEAAYQALRRLVEEKERS